MKIFIKFSTYFLVVAGIILMIFPVVWFPTFYDVRYMGWTMFAWALCINFLPKIVYLLPIKVGDKDWVAGILQFSFAVSIVGDALGAMGLYELYKIGIPYDKFLHLAIPLLWVINLVIILETHFQVKRLRAGVATFIFIIFCGVLWEFFEFICDYFFHTHLSGEFGLYISEDTRMDLIFDLIGSGLGAILSYFRPRFLTRLYEKMK